MGDNPSVFKKESNCRFEHLVINRTKSCPNHPVEGVSWNDVQGFISTLNQGTDGYKYRLPTEAEWEYAARAGTETPFNLGHKISPDLVNYYNDYRGAVGYRGKPVAVGSLPNANKFGLFDMHGNVQEFVQDIFNWNYGLNKNQRFIIDPTGPLAGPYRTIRGGSWFDGAWNLRSARRRKLLPSTRNVRTGFRLLRTPQ